MWSAASETRRQRTLPPPSGSWALGPSPREPPSSPPCPDCPARFLARGPKTTVRDSTHCEADGWPDDAHLIDGAGRVHLSSESAAPETVARQVSESNESPSREQTSPLRPHTANVRSRSACCKKSDGFAVTPVCGSNSQAGASESESERAGPGECSLEAPSACADEGRIEKEARSPAAGDLARHVASRSEQWVAESLGGSPCSHGYRSPARKSIHELRAQRLSRPVR